MLLLNVPYTEKDEAKALGAKWNPSEKSWVAPGSTYNEYKKYSRWFDGSIIVQNELYLIDAARICWKCGKTTKVVCFALKNYVDINSQYLDYHYFLTSMITKMPGEVFNHIQGHYNFKEKYSNTIKGKCWANCCSHCDSLQGNNYLFYELDSPFYADAPEKARQLTMYRISLPFDMCVDLGATFPIVISGQDYDIVSKMLDKYAIHVDLNL